MQNVNQVLKKRSYLNSKIMFFVRISPYLYISAYNLYCIHTGIAIFFSASSLKQNIWWTICPPKGTLTSNSFFTYIKVPQISENYENLFYLRQSEFGRTICPPNYPEESQLVHQILYKLLLQDFIQQCDEPTKKILRGKRLVQNSIIVCFHSFIV